MLLNKRLQLTLFLDEKDAFSFDEVRREYNIEQYQFILSHVTLCRENELKNIKLLIKRLKKSNIKSITINFGLPVRFSEGKGVFIPGRGKNYAFKNLRKIILKDDYDDTLEYEPHITLIHPRNGTCTDVIFENIRNFSFPSTLSFNKISLIQEQDDGRWQVLDFIDLS